MRRHRLVGNLIVGLALSLIVNACGSEATSSGVTLDQTASTTAEGQTDEVAEDGTDDEPEPEPEPELEREPERIAAATDAITITADTGPGWRLVSADANRGHPHEVAVATSERSLDRAADDGWLERRPTANFADEIVIILAPAVSGSCPAIIFNGLSITDDRVYGLFEPGPVPDGGDSCTSDANPIAFVLLVERQALSEAFTLSVEEEVVCGGCDQAEIVVDLADEAAQEAALWGTGTFDIVIDGTPPAAGTANVFRWAEQEALMLPASAFTDLPRWIQGFPGDTAITIEAFVVDCGEQGCAEECDGDSCQSLIPLGDVCSYDYEPEPFIDRTATITWSGPDCEITSVPRRAGS